MNIEKSNSKACGGGKTTDTGGTRNTKTNHDESQEGERRQKELSVDFEGRNHLERAESLPV